MNSHKAFIIGFSASFLVTLTLVLIMNDKYYFLFMYAGFVPSLIDHVKNLRKKTQ